MIALLLVGIKGLLVTAFCVAFPVAMFYFYTSMTEWVLEICLGAFGGMSEVTLSASGLAAWILQTVQFPQALSLYMSLLTLGFVIRLARG